MIEIQTGYHEIGSHTEQELFCIQEVNKRSVVHQYNGRAFPFPIGFVRGLDPNALEGIVEAHSKIQGIQHKLLHRLYCGFGGIGGLRSKGIDLGKEPIFF